MPENRGYINAEKIDGIDKFKVEGAADTIDRAFEIRQDKKLVAAAMKVLTNRQKLAQQAKGWAGKLGKS